MAARKRKADCTPEEWAKVREYSRDWKRKQRAENPMFVAKIAEARCTPEGRIRELWFQARYRAKKKGIAFTITIADLLPAPTHCCVFPWVALNYGPGGKNDFNRASVDRIDNTKGYEPGNVCVISRRANTIKCDATVSELERVLAYAAGLL